MVYDQQSFLGEKYHPHWVWFLALIVVPVFLLLTSVIGLDIGSVVPFGLAHMGPMLAVLICVVGMAAALLRGRRTAIGIAGAGLFLSVTGLASLWWLSRG